MTTLGLSVSGIFAVLAYSVGTRRREFAIRIALGARSQRIVWLVLVEGMAFPVAGLIVGVAASFALSRVLELSLYETSPLDPRVFMSMTALILAAAAVAGLIPAWRTTRADPVESLRAE